MARSHHVCPWWLGPVLCCPLRRWVEQSPEEMLAPYVREGMTVLEPGPGMGWFTLPMARMVGSGGKVIAPELQPGMVKGLRRRAQRAGLDGRIEAFLCTAENLGLDQWRGRIDAAVAIHVVHETPDPRALLRQIHDAVRSGGALLVVEPKGHVSANDFDATVADAVAVGFALRSRQIVRRDLTAVLERS